MAPVCLSPNTTEDPLLSLNDPHGRVREDVAVRLTNFPTHFPVADQLLVGYSAAVPFQLASWKTHTVLPGQVKSGVAPDVVRGHEKVPVCGQV